MGDGQAARLLFATVLALFLVTGTATSLWISNAVFEDPFCYGRSYLWNATDMGSLSFSDAALFFSAQPVENYGYPGLTMTFASGLVFRLGYLASRVLGDTTPYLDHVVIHHRTYFFLCSLLSSLFLAASTWPMILLCRRVVRADLAWITGALYLSAVPTLLYINRFSHEGYVLFFGLWSAEWSLRHLSEERSLRSAVLMGTAAALSFLAKPLMAPIAVLNLVALAYRANGGRLTLAPRPVEVLGYLGSALALTSALAWKLPIAAWLGVWQNFFRRAWSGSGPRESMGALEFLQTPHQRPFLAANILLCALAVAGLVVAFRRRPASYGPLVVAALTGTQLLMLGRRPDWHYGFGFYWALLLFGVVAVEALLERVGLRRQLPLATFAAVVLVLNSWCYWGVATSYKHYHDRFWERRDLLARDPLALPAIWEKGVGNSDLSELFPVHSPNLQASIDRLRAARKRY